MFKHISKKNHLLSLSLGLLFFSYAGTQQFITIHFKEMGIRSEGFIILILVYSFFGLSSLLIGPHVVSKFGLKQSMIGSSLIYILFEISILFDKVFIIFLGAALLGISAGIIWISQGVYILLASPHGHETENTGYFFSVSSFFCFWGVTTLGFLRDLFSFTTGMLILILVAFVSLILLFMIEDITIQKKIESSESSIINITKDKKLLKMAFFCFFSFILWGFIFGQMPLEIDNQLGGMYVKYFASVLYLLFFIMSFPLGKTTDKLGMKRAILIILTIAVFSLIILMLNSNPIFLISGIVGVALCVSVMRPLTQALPKQLIVPEKYRYLVGVFWFAQTIGILFSLVLPLFLSIQLMYLVMVLIGLTCIVVMLGLGNRFALNANTD